MNHLDDVQYKGKKSVADQKHHVVSIAIFNHNVDLFIQEKSFLLTQVKTIEADTIYGDTEWKIVFKDWADVDDIRLPYQISYSLNGVNIAHERRHDIVLNTPIVSDTFSIPQELQLPLDKEDYRWGLRSSQFFARTLAFAIPFDINQGRANLVDIQPVANKVFHVKGPTHNSMIIEMEDYLILVDPVLYEHRSQAIIEKVFQQWPNKKIQYVVASHFHADHIGGIRAYAALGATIIVGPESKDHYEAIFEAQHTIEVDSFQLNPVQVEIIEIDEDEMYVLNDGDRRVKIFPIDNSHALGLLLPYIEDVRMIFTSDVYSPGAFPSPIPPLFSTWTLDLHQALNNIDLNIDYLVGAHGGIARYETFLQDVELLQ